MSRLFILALAALPELAWALRPPPQGCGSVTPSGECSGPIVQYCNDAVQPNQLITVDCTVEYGNGAVCYVDQGGRAACAAGLGGPCLRLDPSGATTSVTCVGGTPGCVQDSVSSQCMEPLAACTPNEVGTCRADRLVRGCRETQPWLLDCVAFGATCSGNLCVGADLGQICHQHVTCEAPNVCGRLSRCEAPPAPDAGALPDAAPLPDAMPRADVGVAAPDAAPAEPDAATAAPDAAAMAARDAAAIAAPDAAGAGDAGRTGPDVNEGAATDDCACSSARSGRAPLEALLLAIAALAARRRFT